MGRCEAKLNQTFKTYSRENRADSSCFIKQRAFLHGPRLAKCSVPLVVNKELQMSAVFNVREGMGLARKSELVGPTKCWPDIFFLQLQCKGTCLHSAVMVYTAPNI